MTNFDKYVCDYIDTHTVSDSIIMLSNHIDYISYCKYSHSVNRLKQDDKKIGHIRAMVNFLQLISTETNNISNFKNIYFGG